MLSNYMEKKGWVYPAVEGRITVLNRAPAPQATLAPLGLLVLFVLSC